MSFKLGDIIVNKNYGEVIFLVLENQDKGGDIKTFTLNHSYKEYIGSTTSLWSEDETEYYLLKDQVFISI